MIKTCRKEACVVDKRPLIAHIIYKLDYGGLENGVVNLINRMPASDWRHCIICMTDFTEFGQRILRTDVEIYALNKPAGKALGTYVQLWRLLRRIRPDIVHTRNLATLEGQVPAFFAGIKGRVHGEHGWDMANLSGGNQRHRWLRKLIRPFVQQYIALSRDLQAYLERSIGVDSSRLTQIYNGVDDSRFSPDDSADNDLPWPKGGVFVFGTVGRLQAVKDQLTLVRAFAHLRLNHEAEAAKARLVIVGDGPQFAPLQQAIQQAGLGDKVWLTGSRDDIPHLMRSMNVFVLPSLSEGISNTILEAMACGLPVIATQVGGNPELITVGETGSLVPAADYQQLAQEMAKYLLDPEMAGRCGKHARADVERRFGLNRMMEQYVGVYRRVLKLN